MMKRQVGHAPELFVWYSNSILDVLLDCFHIKIGIQVTESELRVALLAAYTPNALNLGQSMERSINIATRVSKKRPG